MKSKIVLTTFLGLLVLVLIFLNMRAILRPTKYQEVYQERCELNENRLTAITLLQELYHERNHYYASSIDTLIDFYENGELISINSKDNPPKDSVNDEKFMERFMNMTMKQREESGYVIFDTTRTTVKARMESELAEKNAKKEGNLITMKDFYNIPYTNQKYKIETSAADSITTKFAIYVPIETLMVNFEQSLPKSKISKLIYGGMEDVYNPAIKEKNMKDTREIRNFTGLQLGDTIVNSLEITPYGASK
ncbi:MAG: hypothetical protein II757_04530 [Bacteroidales bacterium]|jgi:hypothetical protein|nr:hypothetical protein [Bacteroidales bacterium]